MTRQEIRDMAGSLETVCLDLKALYDDIAGRVMSGGESADDFSDVETFCGHTIERTEAMGDEWYDLRHDFHSSMVLCCDGEQCLALGRDGGTVTLVSWENIDNPDVDGLDVEFRLSERELDIAAHTGGAR